MGVDVTFLTLMHRDSDDVSTILEVKRRHKLWPLIEQCHTAELAGSLNGPFATDENDEYCYGQFELDDYDRPLMKVPAIFLKTLHSHQGVKDNFQNRAVWAYLEQLPDDWPIVVFWC